MVLAHTRYGNIIAHKDSILRAYPAVGLLGVDEEREGKSNNKKQEIEYKEEREGDELGIGMDRSSQKLVSQSFLKVDMWQEYIGLVNLVLIFWGMVNSRIESDNPLNQSNYWE